MSYYKGKDEMIKSFDMTVQAIISIRNNNKIDNDSYLNLAIDLMLRCAQKQRKIKLW